MLKGRVAKMSKLMVGNMVLGRLENNCYYLHKEGEKETIMVDPSTKADHIYETLKEKGAGQADTIFLLVIDTEKKKTTILNILSGTYSLKEGTLSFDNKPVIIKRTLWRCDNLCRP